MCIFTRKTTQYIQKYQCNGREFEWIKSLWSLCDKHLYMCVVWIDLNNKKKMRMNLIWGPINSYEIELIPELNNFRFVLSTNFFFLFIPFLTNSFEKMAIFHFFTLILIQTIQGVFPHSFKLYFFCCIL